MAQSHGVLRRLLWFLFIWAASIVGLGLVSFAIKVMLR
jgi:hypothetical protein